MQLLQPLEVVVVGGGVGDGPQTEVVHVREGFPVVLEGHALVPEQSVLKLVLLHVVLELERVFEVGPSGLEDGQFIHN